MASHTLYRADNPWDQGRDLYNDMPVEVMGRSTAVTWGPILFHKLRRTRDSGVWNGHLYEDVPAMTIPI